MLACIACCNPDNQLQYSRTQQERKSKNGLKCDDGVRYEHPWLDGTGGSGFTLFLCAVGIPV